MRKRRALRVVGLAAALAAALSLAAALAVCVSWLAIGWDGEGAGEYPGGTVLRDSSGNVIRVAFGPGDVDCRPWYEADPDDWIVKAVVASEDGTFWEHCGVRPLSMARAFVQNVFSRRRISGASTITMQAVRLIKPHPKTYAAKWVEAFQAMKMEREKSKTWILSQYLNRAPFGSNLVGIEAAAQGWFGKSAKELGPGEAALLAGLVQSPSRFRPDRRMDLALRRRDYVLSRMLETGLVTAEQMEGAKSVLPEVKRARRPFLAPHYCDWYLADVLKRPGEAESRSGDFTTPLDADIQAICQKTVDEAAAEGGYSAAAVVARTDTGEVVAMAVSGDYFGGEGSQVNTALAPRPAGSTLKPFLVALALDLGYAGRDSEVVDLPMALKGYRPSNFDGKYRGKVALRDALILSLNLPFVRMLKEIGVSRFASHLRDLGFDHVSAPDEEYGLGLAIGNAEVTLLELVRAYCRLAASRSPSAYIVSDMLSGSERGAAATGHIADVKLPRFAWKTGTSAAYRDAWTVAWNPEYCVGVWCGHLSGGFGDASLVGAKASAPRVWEIVRAIYPRGDGPWFDEPEGTGALSRRRLPEPPAAETKPALEIAKPAKGTVFRVMPGMPQQKLVATVIGNPAGGKLWWFIDGVPSGETSGSAPFVADLVPGRHVLSCSREDGFCAETDFSVE
ncbi:MAG: transglycosylase domain-containing protein [Kiritimatiellae bacterium]|nr:transglycosylase domain-containing protein [Kiritimatiellia bacterium]